MSILPRHAGKHFINGQFVEPHSGRTFDLKSPVDEKVYGAAAFGDKHDIDAAVEAASAALNGKWKEYGSSGRQRFLLRLADLIERDAKELGELETLQNGGPLGLQTAVVQGIARDLRYYAGWADKVDGRVPMRDGAFQVVTYREPIGVCAIIVPWNVPLWALLTKLGPCLAAGNTAVVKPAEQTPFSALRVAELLAELELPAGVVNIVNGDGPNAGAPLVAHPTVRKVAFTGSTQVGRLIMRGAADSNLKRVQLELGGKSALIVCEDADVNVAAEIARIALFSNNGELCTAASRTFVHESIYDKFVEAAAKVAKKMSVGDPKSSDVGPLVDEQQFKSVLSFIDKGKSEGARLVCGGSRSGSCGYFVQPTVFADVTDAMTIAREEIFGPVQSILKYSTLDEAIARANSSEYGLAAGIVTNSLSYAQKAIAELEAGYVWVNTWHVVSPIAEFGGYKASGFGREGGEDGAKAWTIVKSAVIASNL